MDNLGTQLLVYTKDETFPEYLHYQMNALSRIEWGETTDFVDIDEVLREPLHRFVVVHGKRLVAYADVKEVELELNGVSYLCGGLGGVLTFPAFRRQGYGGQVVQAATRLIQDSAYMDIGLLWAAPENSPLYARCGWEVIPGLTTLIGNPAVPYDEELRMMLFVSERGKQARAEFEHAEIFVGLDIW